jgi:ABC-2 type transport system permease protein
MTTVPWWIAAREAFLLSGGPLLRSPRYHIAVALVLLPVFFGYRQLLESYIGLKLLPLAVLVLGSAIVAEDRERGALAYLLTRPIDRWTLLAGKCAASLLGMAAPTLLAMTLSALHSTIGFAEWPSRFQRDLGVAALALLSYGALMVLLGVATKRPVVWGLLFMFVWEQLVYLPGVFPRLTLVAYLRHLLESNGAASAFGPTGLSIGVLLGVGVTSFYAAAWIFSEREYVSEPEHGTE